MDISKASNFERYVFDLVGRDAERLRSLWRSVDASGELDLSGGEYRGRVEESGMVSGSSRHADRLEIMRRVWKDYGVMIDTHTADGLKVGLEHREPGVPLVCLETALPVKFADSVREALGRDPERPAGYEDIESLPQRFDTMAADAQAIKDYIARRLESRGLAA